MTARKKAGQEGFAEEIDELLRLARQATSTDDWELAERYYRHALSLIEESGADTDKRRVVEAALRDVSARRRPGAA